MSRLNSPENSSDTVHIETLIPDFDLDTGVGALSTTPAMAGRLLKRIPDP